jgi:hypothetical protein
MSERRDRGSAGEGAGCRQALSSLAVNQILLGAALPFAVVAMLYARAGFRASNRLLLRGPLWVAAGAVWAVLPDFPRLWGDQLWYNDLHHHPHCWIWFNHCRIDRVEVDTPLWTVLFMAMGAAFVLAASRELAIREGRRG